MRPFSHVLLAHYVGARHNMPVNILFTNLAEENVLLDVIYVVLFWDW